MNITEEIIVPDMNFIERRIVLFPQLADFEDMRMRAFSRGYKSGWARGLVVGMAIVGVGVLCIWLALT